MNPRTISPAAQAEINQLSQEMNSLQTQMENCYGKIGVQYYNLRSENPDPELAEAVAELKNYERRRSQIDTRVKFLNGIVVCTKCNMENDVAESFCVNCGTKLPHKIAIQDDGHCPNCGNVIKPGQKFCGCCGCVIPEKEVPAPEAPAEEAAPEETVMNPVPETSGEANATETPVVPTEEAPAQEVVTEEAPAEAPAMFCPNCGAKISANDGIFCGECGFRLN